MTIADAGVERALGEGRDLLAWWADVEAGRLSIGRFDLLPAFPGGDAVRGFFCDVRAGGATHPYMGYSADYFFDLGGGADIDAPHTAAWLTDQAEAFALRYWLRADAWALPQPYPLVDPPPPPAWLKFLDLNPSSKRDLVGVTNVMRTFKRRASGTTGQFPEAVAREIVDLRELATTYEWITIERLAQGLHVTIALPWAAGLSVSTPLAASAILAMHADLTIRRRDPEPGVLGEFGQAFCPVSPAGLTPSGGLADLQSGLRLQTLRVRDTGEVRLKVVTILRRGAAASQPFTNGSALTRTAHALLTLSRLAGAAATPEQVERHLLCGHAIHLRDTLLGTRTVWQQVADWCDAAAIPAWILEGKRG